MNNEPAPQNQTPSVLPPQQQFNPPKSRKKLFVALTVVLILGLAVAGYFLLKPDKAKDSTKTSQSTTQTQTTTTVEGLQLDPTKDYGDKYADGILPVGDNQYSTTAAEKGKVYMCNANFVPASQAGAQTRGPWFVGTSKWNINKKYKVRGSVSWKQALTIELKNGQHIITTNGLPDHITGIFPVDASDPAYAYDRNPNTIKSQSLVYTLTADPSYGDPECMGGEVGVMLTGIPLFNAFDAGGRDAGAWEIQDACEGHPQGSGSYHYHTLSSCIKNVGVDTVIGYALDGFPITGAKVKDKSILTTSDLDECHGITSEIMVDGKKVTSYHYVMTEDFPYSVSCFRAKAVEAPGKHSDGQNSQPPRP